MNESRRMEAIGIERYGESGRQMKMPAKYRFIFIQQSNGEQFEGHPVYRIYNNKSKTQIGIISWYKPWKEYVFSSMSECVFNNACLRDVLDFIENQIKKG